MRSKFMAVRRVLSFCIVLCLAACGREHRVVPAFYWWKTTYAPSAFEKSLIPALSASKQYIRFFDVDADATGRTLPRAVLRFATPLPAAVREAVPVVFITSTALASVADTTKAAALAASICTLVDTLSGRASFRPTELQLDCDWTRRSKQAYFALVRAVQWQPFMRGKRLSVTIRLHQIKYSASSGIPPADRGMLMCYNMGNTQKPGGHNSILDAALAEEYLRDVGGYPLPLDLALPLFRWTLLFRNDRFAGILRDVPPEALRGAAFLERVDDRRYRCSTGAELAGYTLQRGDVLRIEEATTRQIRQVAHYAADRIRNPDLTVALYHLDSLTCAKYSTDELEGFFRVCR